jgi:hypothetical protein
MAGDIHGTVLPADQMSRFPRNWPARPPAGILGSRQIYR